jgi:hypothetical protein
MAQQAEDFGAWFEQNGGQAYSDENFAATSTSTPRRRPNGTPQQTAAADDLPRVAEQSRSLYLDHLQRQINDEGQGRDLGQDGYNKIIFINPINDAPVKIIYFCSV